MRRLFVPTLLFSVSLASTEIAGSNASKEDPDGQNIAVTTSSTASPPSFSGTWDFVGLNRAARLYTQENDPATINFLTSAEITSFTLYESIDGQLDEAISSPHNVSTAEDSTESKPSAGNRQRGRPVRRDADDAFEVAKTPQTGYTITLHPDGDIISTKVRVFYFQATSSSDGAANSYFFALVDETSAGSVPADVKETVTDQIPAQDIDAEVPTTSSESNGLLNPATTGSESSPTATNDAATGLDSKPKEDDSGGGGLAPGTIAGIAIGAFAAVVITLGLIWFFMRRRKRANKMSVHPDASTPLAGYPNAAARSGEYMGEKEAGAMAMAESPRSQMYTDQPDHHRSSQGPSTLGTAAVGGGASSRYAEGYDAGSSPPPPSAAAVAAGHATPLPPREESSRADMNSPVPSTTVARHLVDPDMTEDEIRRLEEEERELDRQIQEAGRRK